MKDFLEKEAKVGDIVIGCFSNKYNEFVKQRIIKITSKTVFVEPLHPEEYIGRLGPQRKYNSNQFIIIND